MGTQASQIVQEAFQVCSKSNLVRAHVIATAAETIAQLNAATIADHVHQVMTAMIYVQKDAHQLPTFAI